MVRASFKLSNFSFGQLINRKIGLELEFVRIKRKRDKVPGGTKEDFLLIQRQNKIVKELKKTRNEIRRR